MMKDTVWVTGGCDSWYLDASGQASVVWPSTARRYREWTRGFDLEAYDVVRRSAVPPPRPRRIGFAHARFHVGRPARAAAPVRPRRAPVPRQDDRHGHARGQGAHDLRRLGRAHAPAGGRVRRARPRARRTRRHVRLEHRPAPRALLRRAVQRPGAAHAEHPAVPGADHATSSTTPRTRSIFVDRSLLPIFWPLVATFEARQAPRRHGRRGRSPRSRTTRACTTTRSCSPRRERVDFRDRRREPAPPRCVTRAARPATRRASSTRTARWCCTAMGSMVADSLAVSERDTILPVVPMFHANAWGLAHSGGHGRRVARDARAGPVGAGDRRADGVRARHARRRRPDDLERRRRRAGRPRPVGADAHRLRRVGRAEVAVGGLPREDRPADPAGLGHDGDEPARVGLHDQEHARGPLARGARRRADGRAGLPVPLVDARIIDADTDAELPWDGDARGELQVRGPWIAAGYHKVERSPASFTADGWLRTGDVATIDAEGYIRLVDRTKDLIKSGGEWISSVELENEIMADPRVVEACVIGVQDEKWGERPLAAVVAAPGEALTADEVRGVPRRADPQVVDAGARSSSSTRSPRRPSASSARRICARDSPDRYRLLPVHGRRRDARPSRRSCGRVAVRQVRAVCGARNRAVAGRVRRRSTRISRRRTRSRGATFSVKADTICVATNKVTDDTSPRPLSQIPAAADDARPAPSAPSSSRFVRSAEPRDHQAPAGNRVLQLHRASRSHCSPRSRPAPARRSRSARHRATPGLLNAATGEGQQRATALGMPQLRHLSPLGSPLRALVPAGRAG